MSIRLNWASIHYSGCPAACRCWSSHVEQRERFSTSHLPAGAHSSLENQVSLFGRRLEATIRAAGRGSLTVSLGTDRRSLFITFSSCMDSFSAGTQHTPSGGEAVYRFQYSRSDSKSNPEGMWVIIELGSPALLKNVANCSWKYIFLK